MEFRERSNEMGKKSIKHPIEMQIKNVVEFSLLRAGSNYGEKWACRSRKMGKLSFDIDKLLHHCEKVIFQLFFALLESRTKGIHVRRLVDGAEPCISVFVREQARMHFPLGLTFSIYRYICLP